MSMKRFVISIDALDADTINAVTAYLEGLPIVWWHWLRYTWLVVDYDETLTIESLTSKMTELVQPGNYLVLEIGSINHWGGYGPAEEEGKEGEAPRNMFNWLNEYFSPD